MSDENKNQNWEFRIVGAGKMATQHLQLKLKDQWWKTVSQRRGRCWCAIPVVGDCHPEERQMLLCNPGLGHRSSTSLGGAAQTAGTSQWAPDSRGHLLQDIRGAAVQEDNVNLWLLWEPTHRHTSQACTYIHTNAHTQKHRHTCAYAHAHQKKRWVRQRAFCTYFTLCEIHRKNSYETQTNILAWRCTTYIIVPLN